MSFAEIWDALKAVANDSDDDLLILDAAGCRIARNDLSSVYDEKGESSVSVLHHCEDTVNHLATSRRPFKSSVQRHLFMTALRHFYSIYMLSYTDMLMHVSHKKSCNKI